LADPTGTPGSTTLPSNRGAIGSGPSSGSTTATGGTNATALADAQILFILQTANAGEMEQARLAQQKAKNGRVKRFAAMMLKDHGDADEKGRDVAKKARVTPAPSDVSRSLETDAKQMTSRMSTQREAEFDQTYIEAQVKEHQALLDLIDRQMLPGAQTSEVREMLTTLRPKIDGHLKEAMDIQKGLSGPLGSSK
jgi:putative membrane protein